MKRAPAKPGKSNALPKLRFLDFFKLFTVLGNYYIPWVNNYFNF